MDYADKWLVCADCGRQFMWDAGEQAWFQGKKLANEPRHCKPCRDLRRDARMHQPRQYSKVSCERCGNPTYVPFVPQGIKPVYCRACLGRVQS
jgi:CxxC-x17-CxxC domain-containing protein